MRVMNYARRCKSKQGCERFNTVHAANNSITFCGKELNEMWWIESSCGLSQEDITCQKCRSAMRIMTKLED